MNMLKFSFAAIATCILASCASRSEYLSDSGVIWNTTYHITYRSDTARTALILNTLNGITASVSPFDSTSLLAALNRGEAVTADTHLRTMFENSQRICRLSGGAFDPTLAPLINLWGFGYRNGDGSASDADIDSVMQYVGILQCSIDSSGHIAKKHPSTEFNFSAIAKGYGSDCVGRALAAHGVTDYMIEIGGEIALAGRNPHGQPWTIQIDAPETDNNDSHESLTFISVTDCGIATSGNYRNYRRDAAGHTYGHTISVSTGRPVQTATLSATVIAPTAMDADALATACMAMDADEAIRMIDAIPGASCLLVIAPRTSGAAYSIRTSSHWPATQPD